VRACAWVGAESSGSPAQSLPRPSPPPSTADPLHGSKRGATPSTPAAKSKGARRASAGSAAAASKGVGWVEKLATAAAGGARAAPAEPAGHEDGLSGPRGLVDSLMHDSSAGNVPVMFAQVWNHLVKPKSLQNQVFGKYVMKGYKPKERGLKWTLKTLSDVLDGLRAMEYKGVPRGKLPPDSNRVPLDVFIVDYFIHVFGLPKLAGKAYGDLMWNLIQAGDNDIKINMFGAFLRGELSQVRTRACVECLRALRHCES
jgi:hypothetical protein